MADVIGALLPLAAATALSPFPVIAMVFVLGAPGARANGLALAAGWVLGLVLSGAVVLLLAQGSDTPAGEDPPTVDSVLRVLVGVALVAVAVAKGRAALAADAEPKLPGWIRVLDDLHPAKATVVGVALSTLNPKNLGLTIAAGLAVAEAGLRPGSRAGALAVFVVLGSAGTAAPLALFLVLGDAAAGRLEAFKTWLEANAAIVGAVVMLLIGLALAGKGLGALV